MRASSSPPGPLTDGYLPAAAFTHLAPTFVGLIDLESQLQPVSALGAEIEGQADAIILVRAHGDPLAFIHIEVAGKPPSTDELADLIQSELGAQIGSHMQRHGCSLSVTGAPAPGSGTGEGSQEGQAATDRSATVGVIVPTVGRIDDLRRCLGSILASSRRTAEVTVVDNRPNPVTRRFVQRLASDDPRVRYVAEPRPGVSVARNRGVVDTAAEYVAFTDEDAVVDPAWLDRLLAPFADPRVTVVAGLVLPLELQTPAQKRFEQYGGFSRGVIGRAYDLKDARADERVLYPFWGGIFGSGNNLAFRRDELVAAGGFDPRLGPGSLALAGEDMDAMSTAILRGGRLVYEPRALVWHQHRRDDEALNHQLFNYGVGLTATLTKAITTDWRFFAAAARSVPILVKLRRRRRLSGSGQLEGARLQKQYARQERRGMLRGPARFALSTLRSRRLRLGKLIDDAHRLGDHNTCNDAAQSGRRIGGRLAQDADGRGQKRGR